MKAITVEITGTTALLQHRFGEVAEGESGATTRTTMVNRGTPREQAEAVAYRLPDGGLYLPGAAIARLLREAGAGHKQKGSRRSIKCVVPAAVLVADDAIALHNGAPLTDFEVDSRPVTIPATKGRIMRHRPRLDAWQATFVLARRGPPRRPVGLHPRLAAALRPGRRAGGARGRGRRRALDDPAPGAGQPGALGAPGTVRSKRPAAMVTFRRFPGRPVGIHRDCGGVVAPAQPPGGPR